MSQKTQPPHPSRIDAVTLGGRMEVSQVVAVARYGARVRFSREYEERVRRCRALADRFAEQETPVYGITTGLGENWNRKVPPEARRTVQRNFARTHACSLGEPLPKECVRALMAVMLQHLGSGHTGIALETLELLAGMLNRDVIPRVPAHGSVGYLCHEGHIASALIGEGTVVHEGREMPARVGLERAGLAPRTLESKEGLSLTSGTTFVTALACLGFHDAWTGACTADVVAALSLEALKGTLMAMDPRVHAARPHEHQIRTAANLRRLLGDSGILARWKGHRVQDALSLRCIPQLHGAAKKLLADGLATLETELNSSVDNPLIFPGEDEQGEALMACNADGSYVGMAADCGAIAVTGIAKMSERRADRLINHHVSELPPFLTPRPGENCGLMIPQYAAAGILGEMRLLSHPATVDNGFTSACQEDYTSMGANASLKLYHLGTLLDYVLATELLNACQGLEFHPESPAAATAAVHRLVRAQVPPLEEDYRPGPYVEILADLIRSGAVLEAAEAVTGALD
ncbi:HAL/PAL/TAL family ammonia-lyase [Aminomonas paucivorans]|uniref:HAL/PAL/TAL family ammonia-lyase n=1 Tax=Aminomonas paucivorans TaxID=81412 RepID=UPI00331CEBDD